MTRKDKEEETRKDKEIETWKDIKRKIHKKNNNLESQWTLQPLYLFVKPK